MLRQSSRTQKSGYWRQISRPTSSRSRCFSFSPIVRTHDTISVREIEAAPPDGAVVRATGDSFPDSRPAAGRRTHKIARQRTGVRSRTRSRPRPRRMRSSCTSGHQEDRARRARGHHPASRSSALPVRLRGTSVEDRTPGSPACARNRGET